MSTVTTNKVTILNTNAVQASYTNPVTWIPYNKVTIAAYSLKTFTHQIAGPFIYYIDVTTTSEIYSQHVFINKQVQYYYCKHVSG